MLVVSKWPLRALSTDRRHTRRWPRSPIQTSILTGEHGIAPTPALIPMKKVAAECSWSPTTSSGLRGSCQAVLMTDERCCGGMR